MSCAVSEKKVSKVHVISFSKGIWKTLALAHEGLKEVRHNNLTLLRHQYEMFTMEHNASIQFIIAKLQTLLNNLWSLKTTLSNYDINDKVL